MLGVPMGSDEKAAAYVEGKLFSRLSAMVNRLVDFDDTQSAFFLLRVSFTIVRAVHFMRTTPLSMWRSQASRFDETIRFAAENILGVPFTDQVYRQACLTPRLGGFGLRRAVDHAEIAFSASWHEAQATCHEPWAPRDDVKSFQSQKIGSFQKDQEILKALISEAPNTRERQRLNRLQCEHAGAWVSAVPSILDGKHTLMQPRNFQVAALLRLGLPVVLEEITCSLCKQIIDNFGDHAACCTKNADLIHRHNRLRNLLDTICTEGGLAPVMEKKGILGDSKSPGRRPGDVTVPLWRRGLGLAIDVAVTCPFAINNLSRSDPCEYYAEAKKHKYYDADFKNTQYEFAAMVFESTGGVNEEGLAVLRQLFRFAAKREGSQLSVYCGRAWARISCNLQSSVAQAVLNRVGGSRALSFDDSISDHVCDGDCNHRHFYLSHLLRCKLASFSLFIY